MVPTPVFRDPIQEPRPRTLEPLRQLKPQTFHTSKGSVAFFNYPPHILSNGINEGIATAEQAAKCLNIGPRELQAMKRRGMPFVVVAGEYERFIIADCLAWRAGTFGKHRLTWDTKNFVTVEGPALRALNAVAARLATK